MNIIDLYPQILSTTMSEGQLVTVRNRNTLELVGVSLELDDIYANSVTGLGRKLNMKIGLVEALSLVAGESFPRLMQEISPPFWHYIDGDVFHGAYGPRIRTQMPNVIGLLDKDQSTRQAIATIWNPLLDQDSRKDIPCTLGFQWLARGDSLIQITTMRSNDVWLGLPYDIFQFTFLQITIAACLGLNPTQYIHSAGSMHLYTSDIDKAIPVSDNTRDTTDSDRKMMMEWHEAVLTFSTDPLTSWRWARGRCLNTLKMMGAERSVKDTFDVLING